MAELADYLELTVTQARDQFRSLLARQPVTSGRQVTFVPVETLLYELVGREAIKAFFGGLGQARSLFRMDGVDAVIRETDDPEVVVTEIRHRGWSHATNAPYQHTALGVIRVRDGLIVRYDDYMNPLVQLLGRTGDLVAALTS